MDVLLLLRKGTIILSRVRGVQRIAGAARWLGSRSRVVRIVEDFDGDLSFSCYLNSHVSSRIFWSGAYSRSQLAILDRVLRPDMTFVDIGANEGEQTIFAAKRVSEGRVISFEPNPDVFKMLDVNVALNRFANVTLVPSGLADHIGEAMLFAGDGRFVDGSYNLGLSSIHPRRGVSTAVANVSLDTLDAYVERNGVERIDLIKVDVEGAELAVLKGAEGVLSRFRPSAIIEINEATSHAGGYRPRAILDFITGHKYKIEGIRDDGSTYVLADYSAPTRDVLCTPLP